MMTPLSTAYDNIRLIRRKVDIAQRELESLPAGHRRDQGVMRLASLTDDLVRAVQDFAEMGYEEQVFQMLSEDAVDMRRTVSGLH
ncbi:hypothetical protein [Pseudooctadecabacter sp.]|uniref:hypothetical protein n=1 Tax=Pseudooctadecabacter sp. TaxID=1966338 RepID=UPI0035C83009